MNNPEVLTPLPAENQLGSLLDLQLGGGVDSLLLRVLMTPLGDFMRRPSKRIRSQMVELGFRLGLGVDQLSAEQKDLCRAFGNVLEVLHAGSLIVDDIEDGSRERRGAPSLHLKYGVPVALNAGNWLYFWPMQMIRSLHLPEDVELKLYRVCHGTLLKAHFGQALDVGVAVDSLAQSEVAGACLASLELKSGALMALAAECGAILAGAATERIASIRRFGLKFGVALQMYDDLGNVKAKLDLSPGYSKRFEDLYLKRMSWLWAAVARNCDERTYSEFVHAVSRLPDESFLLPWFEIHQVVPKAYQQAREFMQEVIADLRAVVDLDEPSSEFIHGLWGQLEKAYV